MQYLQGGIDASHDGLDRMVEKTIELFRGAPVGYCGSFGVGFPYHSTGEQGMTITNPEFNRYSKELIDKVRREMAHSAIWPCVGCQANPGFDPSACRNCNLSGIKPRLVMKTLPDVDVFMIVDKVSPEIRRVIWDTAQKNGCVQSDFDVFGAIRKTQRILTDFKNNNTPEEFLPIDLHIMSKEDFIQACRWVKSGATDVSPEIWSMYAYWKNNKGIDFWFDFVFSLTPHESAGADDEIRQATREARSGLVLHYSTGRIIDMIEEKSERARVLLQHPPTRDILIKRIDSWRELG